MNKSIENRVKKSALAAVSVVLLLLSANASAESNKGTATCSNGNTYTVKCCSGLNGDYVTAAGSCDGNPTSFNCACTYDGCPITGGWCPAS